MPALLAGQELQHRDGARERHPVVSGRGCRDPEIASHYRASDGMAYLDQGAGPTGVVPLTAIAETTLIEMHYRDLRLYWGHDMI